MPDSPGPINAPDLESDELTPKPMIKSQTSNLEDYKGQAKGRSRDVGQEYQPDISGGGKAKSSDTSTDELPEARGTAKPSPKRYGSAK